MSRNYICDRCGGRCYKKHLKNYPFRGKPRYLCKDCRVQLGYEKYDEWIDPFGPNGWWK